MKKLEAVISETRIYIEKKQVPWVRTAECYGGWKDSPRVIMLDVTSCLSGFCSCCSLRLLMWLKQMFHRWPLDVYSVFWVHNLLRTDSQKC